MVYTKTHLFDSFLDDFIILWTLDGTLKGG